AIGLGMALAMRLDGTGGRVFVLLGDSESSEGSVWEAMEAAAFHEVDDLVAILDMNRLGQRGPTMHGWNGDLFARRAQAYGWRTIEIDGHDVVSIDAAYAEAADAAGPTMIVARTEKGHGVSFVADHDGWHGKAMSQEQAAQAIEELGGIRSLTVTPPSPPDIKPLELGELRAEPAPVYTDPIPTRKAFGEALAWLAGHRPDLVVLDGEVGNSTHTDDFQAVAPERFFEMYIAEQAVVGAQTGLQVLGKTAFAATFGAFLTRAFDQMRMGAISRADLRMCGSHAGVSIGEDGPSQMAVEDLAMFRALHSSTVLYPADGTSTVKLVAAMCDLPGISYLRTTREATPVIYGADEEFPVGGSKTLRSTDADAAALVCAGVTVRESLAAADALATDGTAVRVIDAYSVKPIDSATIRRALEETGLVLVIEDHRIEGGLGDAVLDALSETGPINGRVVKLAIRDMPGSGSPEELRAWAGIDAAAIADRVRQEV
ncbi:MAG TPA: transketolase, partial [Actinomycetota bacterium]|nr:transketolase [Actinomycetota bacterium]